MFDDDLSEEFLKISSADKIFSSENRRRQFGATFAAKGGENKYLDKPFLEKVTRIDYLRSESGFTG